jgi:hypothetical protein
MCEATLAAPFDQVDQNSPSPTLGDILREYGPAYRRKTSSAETMMAHCEDHDQGNRKDTTCENDIHTSLWRGLQAEIPFKQLPYQGQGQSHRQRFPCHLLPGMTLGHLRAS